MGKPTGGRSRTGQVSRSGLWLIGGALLLSVVVLAWAFQEEPTTGATAGRRPATPRSPVRGGAAVRINPQTEAGRVSHAPTLADYGPLLQRNVFRPLVVPEGAGSVAVGRGSSPAGRVARAPRGDGAEESGPESTDTWRGWKFNGVAQLDEKTYALMDQTGKKVSRFVKPGDKLEDATVARVVDGEVTLRESGGHIVRVQRVDAMAELLRPSRSGPRSPRDPAAPSAAPTQAPAPTTPGTRSGPVVTTPPNPETPRGVSPTSTALEERRDARRTLRQQRREAGRLEAGENPAVSED